MLTRISECFVLAALAALPALAQPAESQCKPISQRTGEVGCWIIVDNAVGKLPTGPVFWHLDTFPSRAEADKARESRGTVVESMGKVWLLTIGPPDWRPHSGKRISRIGPLPVHQELSYSAMYMEAISTPGMTSAIHTHSGPEAWYTEAGESCLETPQGASYGRAGGPPLIVPGGPPMLLTATGKIRRRALVLILHDASQPPITLEHAWSPKGLCKTP